jgi:hypothetical protein
MELALHLALLVQLVGAHRIIMVDQVVVGLGLMGLLA